MVPVDGFYLVDLGDIDVELRNAFRARRETCRVTGDPVIESCADRDQQVTVLVVTGMPYSFAKRRIGLAALPLMTPPPA